jgi:NADH-quinone oxidoreductase subunit D
MRPGGVYADAPEEFWPALDRFIAETPHLFDDLEKLIVENEIVLVRTKGTGVLSLESAIAGSISGPVLRGSGIAWDWRKADPYDVYRRVEFDIPVGQRGDNYDRFQVRLEEIKQSLRIVQQCRQQIQPGPIRAELPFVIRPPAGAEAYGRVESPKGELAFYMVSDGGVSPYRCKIRSPSLINLTVLKELLVGSKLADMIVTLGSIDINMGEVDR